MAFIVAKLFDIEEVLRQVAWKLALRAEGNKKRDLALSILEKYSDLRG